MTAAYTERWLNPSWRDPVTVPAGAGPAAPGDLETWDLAGPWQAWPPLAEPWHILRLYDPALPGEIIRAAGPPPGPPGQIRVRRGDQGTTPEPHPPGFTLMNCLSGEGVAARIQGVPSGHGVLLPPGQVRTPPLTFTAAGVNTVIVSVQVPAGEAVPGSVYEGVVHGHWTPGAAARPVQIGQLWGAVRLGWGSWPLAAGGEVGSQLRWRVHGIVAIHAEGAVGSLEAQVGRINNANDPMPFYLGGELGPVAVEVDTPVTYSVFVNLEAAGMTATAQGGRAWRAA